ncbi:MAG TPA: superoxide dismutase [Phycisphaerales bacterium]|nr:superoxide dismutase [Phycisphaerales bacterium]
MQSQMDLTRRGALGAMAALGASGALATALGGRAQPEEVASLIRLGWDPAKGEYTLPALPYDYAALEPHIDAQTMRIHHDKHHAGYVAGLNKALAQLAQLRESGDPALVAHWSKQLSFHGGGHINHTLFWHCMAPPSAGGGGEPAGALADAIARDFGAFDGFAWQFKEAAKAVEGSGWAWLAFEPIAGRLVVSQMENQQKLLFTGLVPLLGVDVWEHAYYLKYQNRRADYVDAFMQVVNWPHVAALFDRVLLLQGA